MYISESFGRLMLVRGKENTSSAMHNILYTKRTYFPNVKNFEVIVISKKQFNFLRQLFGIDWTFEKQEPQYNITSKYEFLPGKFSKHDRPFSSSQYCFLKTFKSDLILTLVFLLWYFHLFQRIHVCGPFTQHRSLLLISFPCASSLSGSGKSGNCRTVSFDLFSEGYAH